MDICHEIAHILLCRRTEASKQDDISMLRREVEAWRLAKSFCMPQFWSEKDAIESVITHAKYFPNWEVIFVAGDDPEEKRRKECFDRLKIIPWNQGISLNP